MMKVLFLILGFLLAVNVTTGQEKEEKKVPWTLIYDLVIKELDEEKDMKKTWMQGEKNFFEEDEEDEDDSDDSDDSDDDDDDDKDKDDDDGSKDDTEGENKDDNNNKSNNTTETNNGQ
ncbi:uncharacterized protein LOC141531704 isoform X1 [Cotesia typhae]|uniref:uncharacterized protein LOC141531704 isoform X1 n=1 Tax=Cotesia typhae TaxID=2053667 RepID=UPI003D69F7E4